ncbi:MAG: transposase [Candidatus Bathyarchaeia archaeon]|jgi:transposase
MEEPEFSCTILSKLNLCDIEKVVKEAYHKENSPGRPPRKPMGIFKALIVKRLQQIPSEREICRRLWKDENLRELCDIEAEENPYHPSQLSRFKKRVGNRRLQRIMDKLLKELLRGGVISGETVDSDATFVAAYSRRDPHDNSRGKSDPEARVGRDGKTYGLGYKLHIITDAKSELPLAVIAAPANDNEKKHAPALFRRAWKVSEHRIKTFIADSQYSSRKLRDRLSACGVNAVVPYPANQKKEEAAGGQVLQNHGPSLEKQLYRQRSGVERVNSRQKEQLCLERHRARGLKRVTTHALLFMIAMLLNGVVALRLGRPEKARSITMLAR